MSTALVLTIVVVLAIVDNDEPFELETDASSIQVDVVLNQEGRFVSFESKKLSSAQ